MNDIDKGYYQVVQQNTQPQQVASTKATSKQDNDLTQIFKNVTVKDRKVNEPAKPSRIASGFSVSSGKNNV